ncbi:MAG: DUF368 domain-containing protein [Desulfobacterales bacterium]|nr:DUF368 domain-containing protein [Desulfobacterales bacterium]
MNSSKSDPSSDLSSPFSLIKELFMGFCLGVANIIPGVSGGTFLLVFGIYERVFAVVNQINGGFLSRLLGLSLSAIRHVGGKGTGQELPATLRNTGLLFLITLALGAGVAIVGLSSLMKFLLLNHFSVTYALFFGLILVSVIIPIKMMKHFAATHLIFLFLGIGLTVAVAWMVNPYDKIRMKSDALEQQYLAGETSVHTNLDTRENGGVGKGPFSFTGRYSVDEYVYIGCAGALAISATVLPGISGSLVLILMGAYFDVIAAISAMRHPNLDTLSYLAVLGLGVVMGGIMFAKLVSYVMGRFYNATMAFLTGLMIGSLYALWPFKEVVVMTSQFIREGGQIRMLENVSVQTNINVLPGSEDPLAAALLFFVIGCVVMAGFIKAESGKETS